MASQRKHLDEARAGAAEEMKRVMAGEPAIAAAAIVDDLFGRISVTLWSRDGSSAESTEAAVAKIRAALSEACAQYWTDSITVSDVARPDADDDLVRSTAWNEGVDVDSSGRLRLNDRHRHHTGWFVSADTAEQIWSREQGPPVVVFHGFKGGAGRTTLLASYALACGFRGQRVAIVDVDLDAPGIGTLLAADEVGTTAEWGTVDFLLEAVHQLPLQHYFHTSAPRRGAEGRVEVFPAGQLNDAYLSKLGRVDLDVRRDVRGHALGSLLLRIRRELSPDVILLDGRAGLSPAAGLLLSGIAHLHILVATSNAQSLDGLERVVRHLGFEQARRDLPQGECIVVQAHVPDSTEAAKTSRQYFSARVEDIFRNGYYSRQPTDDDRTWSLIDLGSEIAPHVPVSISYRGRLAHFETIEDIAELLVTDPEYMAFHQRVDERLGIRQQQAASDEEVDG